MLNSGTLTFREFVMGEPLPLATLHEAVFEFLRGRDDAVLFGAHAVNAYVEEPRMTQDIDLLSTRAKELADEIKEHLAERFRIVVRVRKVAGEKGLRLYQARKAGNRHLVDLRPVGELPPAKRVGRILVVEPAELIALKVIAYHMRRGKPKSGTDWRDVAELLLEFPKLKKANGPVTLALTKSGADEAVVETWRKIQSTEMNSNI